ncbi:MAG: alkaline phosphatase PhoX [Gemmatimonadota bacterium]
MLRSTAVSFCVVAGLLAVACDEPQRVTAVEPTPVALRNLSANSAFTFTPIVPFTGAQACLDPASAQNHPLQLPTGFAQKIIGRQSDVITTSSEVNFDMLTLNETGPKAGRYLYRTHEVSPFGALSRIDLETGLSELVVERQDWESLDGLVWTPWGTILFAEEEIVASFRDPAYPNIERGLIYEYSPQTGNVVARPALGARSHEGLRFDAQGNLYGISESRGIQNAGQPGESGSIFKFVPNKHGDLSSGKLYALRVLNGRTGLAVWEPLALDPVTFDSDAAAQAVNATGWDRPEDIEIANKGGGILYVAVTESSNLAQNNGLVLKITLDGDKAFVSNYVEPGVNVAVESGGDSGTGFDDPDNLALAPNGDLYITEDDSPSDIWVARGSGRVASSVVVFARLLDCGAESTGIYFTRNGQTLWVNSQHAQLNNGEDLTIAITRSLGH